MIKFLGLATVALVMAGSTSAQTPDPMPSRDRPTNGGAGVRTGNITATGATVPNPGVSQSGGTTSMDRGIQAQDNKIQNGICKGC